MSRLIRLSLALLLAGPVLLHAQDRRLLRISLENPSDHVQARAVAAFASALDRLAQGRFRIETYHDGTLFRDQDVVRMLDLGRVEMAVPGSWQLAPFEPSFDVFMLPMFHGRSRRLHHLAMDGELGRLLGQGLERKAAVVVLGRWLELGSAHLFGVRRFLDGYSDLAGLLVRSPGGQVNALCLRELGADVVTIAWPDLRACLRAGTIEAVLTTYETTIRGRLRDSGIAAAFESDQYFAMFIPLVSRPFWESLPEDLRALMHK